MPPDPLLLEKIHALRELMDERFAASENAISKADLNLEKWRANANEWRSAMVDREARFASRVETEAEFRALRTEIASLKESRSTDRGRSAGGQALWSALLAVAAILIALATLVLSVLRQSNG